MAQRDYDTEELQAIIRKELQAAKDGDAADRATSVRGLVQSRLTMADAVAKLSSLPTYTQTQAFQSTISARTASAGPGITLAEEDTPDAEMLLGSIQGRIDDATANEVIVKIINEGNFTNLLVFMTLAVEHHESGGASGIAVDPVIQGLVRHVLALRYDQGLYFNRYMYYNQVSVAGAKQPSQIKQEAGIPQDVSLDVLSAKLPLTPAEIFMQLAVESNIVLDTRAFQALNEVGINVIETTIKTKLEELRMYHRHGQILSSSLIDTYTTFLELKTAARADEIKSASDRLLSLGDTALAKYVTSIAHIVARGDLPGGIDPGELQSHRDAVSLTILMDEISTKADGYLRDSTAQGFITRRGISDRTAAGISAGFASMAGPGATVQQKTLARAEALQASMTTIFSPESAFDPSAAKIRDVHVQGAGGPNTMTQQLQFAQTSDIPEFDKREGAALGVALALLLACIHTRIEFTKRTPWELIPTTEVIHLLIITRLAQYAAHGDGMQLQEAATQMYADAVDGHNAHKFTQLQDKFTYLTSSDLQLIETEIEYTARQQLMQIQEFAVTPMLTNLAIHAFMIYLTGKNRGDRMVRDALARRRSSTTGIGKPPAAMLDLQLAENARAYTKEARHAETSRINN